MKPRYFKSTLTGIVWRFSKAGNHVFAGDAGWIPTAMTLEGMAQLTTEITAEEGEP